jgi:putative transposase
MSLIFHPLLALLASVTDRELARYVEFLKEENKILRSRVPGQIRTKPYERDRLLKLGKPLGRAIEELLAIVSPSTFYHWLPYAGKGSNERSPSQLDVAKPKRSET